MLGKAGQPFLAANNVGGAHQVIVNHVREVVGGDSVRLEKYNVLIIFGYLKITADKVGDFYALFGIAVGDCKQGEFVTCRKLCLYLLYGKLTAGEHSLAACLCSSFPVGVFDFSLFVGSRHFGKLLVGGEHGISSSFFNQFFGVYVVKRCTLALTVRTILTKVAVGNCALVENNAVMRQSFYKCFSRTLNLTLCVGVLNTKIENAARLMCKTLTNCYGEHTSEVNKSCGAGSKTRYLCALGKLSGRETLFQLVRSGCDVREKKLC